MGRSWGGDVGLTREDGSSFAWPQVDKAADGARRACFVA
jgi:hypothetical protein